jgi:hypothetical protein
VAGFIEEHVRPWVTACLARRQSFGECDRVIEGMSELRPLSVYAVEVAQTGGSTLYTIKWTGLEPIEGGWSPPSDTTG